MNTNVSEQYSTHARLGIRRYCDRRVCDRSCLSVCLFVSSLTAEKYTLAMLCYAGGNDDYEFD